MSDEEQHKELLEEVIDIRVHTKVTKGGRKLSFAALVAVGDGQGTAGLGYGKARGVPMAIEKAGKRARQDMARINLIGDTIAHEAVGKHGSTKVLLRPAGPGTGVKASSTVRSIMTVVGVRNILSKCFGQNNPINVAKAAVKALHGMRSPEEAERLRGVKLQLHHPQQFRHGESRGAEAPGSGTEDT